MAIRWVEGLKSRIYDADIKDYPGDPKAGTTTHQGLVYDIRKSYGSSWGADITSAEVWNPDTETLESLPIHSLSGGWGNEHSSTYGSAEIDVSPELRHHIDVVLERKARIKAETRWLEENLSLALRVDRGVRVEVYKGRKVAKGTTGIVKWQGTDNFRNAKVGLKVEGVDKLVYTAEDNVRVVLPSDWDPTIPYWMIEW